MRLEGTTIKYTTDDIDQLTLYDYSQEEIDEQIEEARNKIKGQDAWSFPSFLFGVILFVAAVLVKPMSETLFLVCACLSPCMILLGVMIFVSVNPLKVTYYTKYVRVVVQEKKGIITKTWRETGKKKGSYSMSFYPLVVLDSTTGYKTRLYCFEDEYKKAKEGKRINIKYRRSIKHIELVKPITAHGEESETD